MSLHWNEEKRSHPETSRDRISDFAREIKLGNQFFGRIFFGHNIMKPWDLYAHTCDCIAGSGPGSKDVGVGSIDDDESPNQQRRFAYVLRRQMKPVHPRPRHGAGQGTCGAGRAGVKARRA
ncbi:hypothetical protein EVAR_94540_1 [Eumeta japonica]|uniref:Uncharacterized protein n=1 Tax=Eumeta variegata TaxID=151549 RepID=A0A4C1UUS3_EUMVA|nr:hypothetical protein EVAR_94540_1 [Eumeta japonica]